MHHAPRSILTSAAVAAVVFALAACAADPSSPVGVAARASRLAQSSGGGSAVQKIELRDDCDSVTFNAIIGPNACAHRGSTTIAKFNAELSAKQSVGAWWINADKFGAKVGTSLDVVNTGGETHTFTPVAQFGGGIVAGLNAASGNPVVAPECAQLDPATVVASGGHYHTPQLAAGTYKFQCCIHPWMRSTATITN